MRKIFEIRKDLKEAIATVRSLDPAKDKEALEVAMKSMNDLTEELKRALEVEAAEQKLAEQKLETLQKAAGRNFSFLKFFREACSPNGQLTGLEAEVAELGRKEYSRLGLAQKGYAIPSVCLRASAGQNATTNADGGYLKQESPVRYIDGLKDRLVVAALGATILGDLVGTVPVASGSSISASWLAEGASSSVSKVTFSKVSLTPHRCAVEGAFSKDLLRQTSVDVEAIIMDKILSAHAALIDAAAINGSGSSNQPTGILNTSGIGSVVMGTNGAAISWAKVVELETKINSDNANRGKMAYLTNAKVFGALKVTEKASNTARFLLEGDGKLNGYPIDYTNLCPSNLTKGTSSGVCSAMIFGNFEDLYIGQWGGIDIVVDPYTLASQADVRFVLNAWNDCAVVEPKSFAAIKDITT